MPMFRAGLAVAAMLLGAIAAFMGAVMIASALQTGTVSLSYNSGDSIISETVTRAGDTVRYWQLVAALGIAPVVLGVLAARWGWQTINR